MKQHLLLLLSLLLAITVTAQTKKQDAILKINGDEIVGKVTEIGDSAVKFIYSGETLVYTIKKADIQKITFASGRVETYNKPPMPVEIKKEEPTPKRDPAEAHNKVAILPFGYITDNQEADEAMSYKVQTECYTFLNGHSGQYAILDPRTTNALLIKNGATADKLRAYTMDELCDLLGVEYIIEATITQNKTSQSSYQSDSYNATTKETNSKTGKQNTNISGSSSGSVTQNYETSIALNIYTDKNSAIYSQNRKSFWSNGDAYKASLQYILKRSPFYQK